MRILAEAAGSGQRRVTRGGSALRNRAGSGIFFPVVRASLLLLSILLHSVAVLVTLVVGFYAQPVTRPAVAQIEFRNTPPSAPAPREVHVVPDLEVEREADTQPLLDVQLPPKAEVELEPEPVVEDRALAPTPSTILSRLTKERVRVSKPSPAVEEPTPVVEEVEPPQDAPAQATQSVYTAATRCDDGGDPPYPQREFRFGREGKVLLFVTVRADGVVSEVTVKRPSRYTGFNRAAKKAVRSWRFAPATKDGEAIQSEFDLEVVFEIKKRARPLERG